MKRPHTLTALVSIIDAYLRDGRTLYAARLDLTTKRVAFFRGSKRLGSLKWCARRERVVGWISLEVHADADDNSAMLIDELECELRRGLITRLVAGSRMSASDAIDYEGGLRARFLRGDAAKHPALHGRERSFPEVAKSSGQGSGLRLVEVDAAE